jgi:N6-adenosine-specific RNA methylase IME4
MIDPPWPESGGGKCKRGADRHYPLIRTRAEHLSTIVRSDAWGRVAHDSHLYMWSTNNYESWAHWLVDALGFRHLVTLPWVKPGNAGLGQYFRGAHEGLLFAVRGSGPSVRTDARNIRSDALVGDPRPVDECGKRIHSAKPVEAYDLMELRTLGPFLEMYARPGSPAIVRPDWTVWGNEVEQAEPVECEHYWAEVILPDGNVERCPRCDGERPVQRATVEAGETDHE